MNLRLWFFVLVLFFFHKITFAFENLGSVSTALGGAGVGSLESTDGAFNNPSSYALFENRAANLSFTNKSFRASLADNGAEALFPAMIGYSQTKIDGLKNQSFYLGAAQAINQRFAVGATLGVQTLQVDQIDEKYRQTVIDVGAIYRSNEWLTLGVVLKNKPLNDTDLDSSLDDRPTLAVGLESQYQELINLRFELESGKNAESHQKNIFKSGLEVFMNEWIKLRLGYQNNNILSQNYFTAGLGFGGPIFGLHYAYIKESAFKKESFHSIDLAFPF